MSNESKRPYPEHDRLRAIRDKSQTVGEFIEWLEDQGIALTKRDGDTFERIRENITNLLARFFEIDQKKLDAEKDAMLDAQRALNDRV